jgi:hypothetical protein
MEEKDNYLFFIFYVYTLPPKIIYAYILPPEVIYVYNLPMRAFSNFLVEKCHMQCT